MSVASAVRRDLPKASEHLLYEVEMLQRTVHLIVVTAPGTTKNALIESFLVHARLVAQFLGWNRVKKPRFDDVLAEHFSSSWSAGAEPAAIASTHASIAKRVVHLSYARGHASVDRHPWDFPAISLTLLGKVAEFIQQVPAANLATDWAAWRREHQVDGPRGPQFPAVASAAATAPVAAVPGKST
jgi:hypothetical protein